MYFPFTSGHTRLPAFKNPKKKQTRVRVNMRRHATSYKEMFETKRKEKRKSGPAYI
jgi:hypothetical protein